MALLEIKNLSFSYPESGKKALDGVSLSVSEGEFVLLCGESGCGKTTLLSIIKRQMRPEGNLSGEILYKGENIDSLSERESVTDFGYVYQSPEKQIVTDKVWHELAFGPESIGMNTQSIRRRAAEISGFFGISKWYRKDTASLSGGQKQLLNLASVMITDPKVLLLDEPTSQLDPIAASEFIATLRKINDEIGVTIILVEHRLEELFSKVDRVVMMSEGKVVVDSRPQELGKHYDEIEKLPMKYGLPAAMKIARGIGRTDVTPLSVKDGKRLIEEYLSDCGAFADSGEKKPSEDERETVIDISEGFFRYERELPDVLCGMDLRVKKNEFLCILGENGAGKTTALRILGGNRRLYRGKYRLWGKKISEYSTDKLYRRNVSFLPQNPQLLFVKNTLESDLLEATKAMGLNENEGKEKIAAITEKLGIDALLDSHPFDLSGGEQQKAAFAKILLMEPRILLLDEPTKGIDAYSKKILGKMLKGLQKEGITIVMVTHDVEFAAEYADRCAMFFDGQIVSSAPPEEFFSENSYYTTSASRISRGFFGGAVTAAEVIEKLRGIKRG
mgnify:FL=1